MSGELLQSFIEQEVMKNKPYEHFLFLFKMAEFFFWGGVIQFGARKIIADHKVSFCMNRASSRGLMAVLATRSLL